MTSKTVQRANIELNYICMYRGYHLRGYWVHGFNHIPDIHKERQDLKNKHKNYQTDLAVTHATLTQLTPSIMFWVEFEMDLKISFIIKKSICQTQKAKNEKCTPLSFRTPKTQVYKNFAFV